MKPALLFFSELSGGLTMRPQVLGTVALVALLGITGARAEGGLDVCDQLGLSGLTISSDTNCLQISGGVDYEFTWGDYKPCGPEGRGVDCGPVIQVTDDLAFSNLRIALNPYLGMTQTYGRDFLETNGGATLPAFVLDVAPRTFGMGLGVGAKLHYGEYAGIDTHFNVDFGRSSASASLTNEPFATGLGAPNTGNGVIGFYDPGATILNTADFDLDRTFASLDKGFDVTLGGGQFDIGGLPTIDWRTKALFGIRGGWLNERQTFSATTNGATLPTIDYDTAISGGFFGGYAGLGLDKHMDLPNSDFDLYESFYVAAGLDSYRLHVKDTLDASGAVSTHSYYTNATIPTVKAGVGLNFKGDGLSFSLDAGTTMGYLPQFNLDRPVSNDLTTTKTLSVASPMNYYVGMKLTIPIAPPPPP